MGNPGVEPGFYRLIRSASSPAESLPLEESLGFEPRGHVPAPNRFRGGRLNPLSHDSPAEGGALEAHTRVGTPRLAAGPGPWPVHLPSCAGGESNPHGASAPHGSEPCASTISSHPHVAQFLAGGPRRDRPDGMDPTLRVTDRIRTGPMTLARSRAAAGHYGHTEPDRGIEPRLPPYRGGVLNHCH